MGFAAGLQLIVGSKTDAWPIFFPLATVYGMMVVPVSVYSMTTGYVLVPGLATPAGHAHELLFGYVLAVVAGFLLNRVPRWWLIGLLGAWCLARVGSLAAPSALVTDIANVLFIIGFVVAGASRFLPTARKWRNKVFGLNLALLGLAGIAGHLAFSRPVTQLVLVEAVLMISLLMMMMGGRMIAPAVAGHIERRGGTLEARVQPGLEGALIGLMLAAAVCWMLPVNTAIPGALLVVAGMVALVRLGRWKLWWCTDRWDLLALAVGYAWNAFGLILIGSNAMLGGRVVTVLHAVTVGAIGTLTLTVMARVWMQRSRRHPMDFRALPLTIALIAVAAVLRLVPSVPGMSWQAQLQWSAAAWSAAFALVLFGAFAGAAVSSALKEEALWKS